MRQVRLGWARRLLAVGRRGSAAFSLRPDRHGGSSTGTSLDSILSSRRLSSTSAVTMAELIKTGVVLVYLVLAAASNWAVLAFTHDTVGRSPLPDIVFQLIPEQAWATRLGDLTTSLCSFSLILIFVLHRNRVIVLRRCAFITATLYVMRSVCLFCTHLPPGYEDNNMRCRERLNPITRSLSVWFDRFLEQFLTVGFQVTTAKMLCGDLMFSGHTLMMVVSSKTVDYYLPNSCQYLRYFPRLFAVIGMVCMVLSRTHYTIDVLVAYWLTSLIFSQYHAFCEVEKKERESSVLNTMFMFRFVDWLEQNVDSGRMENVFDLPFNRRNAVDRAEEHCEKTISKGAGARGAFLA